MEWIYSISYTWSTYYFNLGEINLNAIVWLVYAMVYSRMYTAYGGVYVYRLNDGVDVCSQ